MSTLHSFFHWVVKASLGWSLTPEAGWRLGMQSPFCLVSTGLDEPPLASEEAGAALLAALPLSPLITTSGLPFVAALSACLGERLLCYL